MSKPPENIVAHRLNARFGAAPAEAILAVALDRYEDHIALVSSFGAEAAVLLHMLATIDRSVPVLMLDTLMLFPETIAYQQALSDHLGLTNVRRITPDETTDPNRMLHRSDSNACCNLRKVAPLEKSLEGFGAIVTGRKRFQTRARQAMDCFEIDGHGRLKVNPLAGWNPAQLAAYMARQELPPHPLVARGYPSIGCWPCTSPVKAGEDTRAGRWRDEAREECGIHFNLDGTIERKAG